MQTKNLFILSLVDAVIDFVMNLRYRCHLVEVFFHIFRESWKEFNFLTADLGFQNIFNSSVGAVGLR